MKKCVMARPPENPPEILWGRESPGTDKTLRPVGCFAQTDIFSRPFSLVPDCLDGTAFMLCFQIPFLLLTNTAWQDSGELILRSVVSQHMSLQPHVALSTAFSLGFWFFFLPCGSYQVCVVFNGISSFGPLIPARAVRVLALLQYLLQLVFD